MQITIRDVLQEKGSAAWSVASSDMVYAALKIFADKDIGALLVIDDGKPEGIFTQRDYARKGVLKAKSSKDTKVGELMEREFFYVMPADTIGSMHGHHDRQACASCTGAGKRQGCRPYKHRGCGEADYFSAGVHHSAA